MSLLRRNPRQRYREPEIFVGKGGRSPTNASNNPPRDQGESTSPPKAPESPPEAPKPKHPVTVTSYRSGDPTVALTISDIGILAFLVAERVEIFEGFNPQSQSVIARAKEFAAMAKHGVNLTIVHGA